MKFRKLLKYIPAATMAAAVSLGAIMVTALPAKSNQNGINKNINQKGSNDAQLAYLKNDVQKQTDVISSIKSMDAVKTSAFSNHMGVILTKDDDSTLLYMWGANDKGQLGNGTVSVNEHIPQLVKFPEGTKIVTVSLGATHSAALLDDGKLYMWGSNDYGELGMGNSGATTNLTTPTPVDSTPFEGLVIDQILCGATTSAVIAEGKFFMWGDFSYGPVDLSASSTPNIQTTPLKIDSSLFGNVNVAHAALGKTHFAVSTLTEDKRPLDALYMWGDNKLFQLSLPDTEPSVKTPRWICDGFLQGYIDEIVLGESHTGILIQNSNALYMWGNNQSGQVGADTEEPAIEEQKLVVIQTQGKVTQLIFGANSSGVVCDDGSVFLWGANDYGQQGNGKDTNVLFPAKFDQTIFNNQNIKSLSLAPSHTMVQLEDDSFYGWGLNEFGQLGVPADATEPFKTAQWVPTIGKPSSISANPDMTSRGVFNKLWVDGQFDPREFRNCFTLVNIPDIPSQEYTMTKEPEFNALDQTFTMNVGIRYYYDENGILVADTSTEKMHITGFKVPGLISNISALPTAPKDVLVHEWLDAVKTDGEFSRAELSKYLELKDIPADATFEISVLETNNKTGTLKFNIIPSKTFLEDNEPAGTHTFEITLNLIPRITVITPIATGYPDQLTPSALKNKLFDENGKVIDIAELLKYVTIFAPSDDQAYQLVNGSWDPKPADGTVSFKVEATNFYNDEGVLVTSGSTKEVQLDLKLLPEVSSIEKKPGKNEIIEVHKFLNYVGTSGTVNTSKLSEFFDIVNMPDAATFEINNAVIQPDYDENLVKNDITFDLKIIGANSGTSTQPIELNKQFTLTLGDQHQPSTLTALTEYPKAISSLQFKQMLADANNVVKDLTFLKKYVSFTSLPADAKLTIEEYNVESTTGLVTFKLASDKWYDSNSDLTSHLSPLLSFNLSPKKQTPVIEATASQFNISAVDFRNEVQKLSSGQVLTNYLFDDYLLLTGEVPAGTTFALESVDVDTFTGKVELAIFPSLYYDANDYVQNGSFIFAGHTITLQMVGLPSDINKKTTYPTDIRVDQFVSKIQSDIFADRSMLEQYFDLTNIPNNATFKISNEVFSDYDEDYTRNKISFDLTISHFNNVASVNEPTTKRFELTLGAQHAPTTIVGKVAPYYDGTTPVDAFFGSFLDASDKVTNLPFLSKYVDVHSLPQGASLSVTDKTIDRTTGEVTFNIVASQVYNNNFDHDLSGDTFAIALTLGQLPSETQITANTNIANPERVDVFVDQITKLSNSGNLFEYLFPKYLTLNGNLPPATTLRVTSINAVEATGAISFALIANKHYDVDGNLQSSKQFDINLILGIKYQPTKISAKTNISDPDRIDTFKTSLQTLSNNDLRAYLFPKYLTLLGDVPNNTTYSIKNLKTTEITGFAQFDLVLGAAYDSDSYSQLDVVYNISLNVKPKYIPTSITLKQYDPTLRVDLVRDKLTSLQGTALYNYLATNFLDFVAVPPTAVVLVNVLRAEETTGVLEFSVSVAPHYNANGDADNTTLTETFTLNLGIKHEPTKVELKGNYSPDLQVDDFMENITTLTGVDLYNFLKDYLEFTSVINQDEVTATVIDYNLTSGSIKFSFNLTAYYDANSNLVIRSHKYSFSLKLAPKFETTTITKVNESLYPKDLMPSELMAKIEETAQVNNGVYTLNDENLALLSKFVDFKWVPQKTTFTLTVVDADDVNGVLEFDLTPDQYFDDDGVFQTQPPVVPFTISLNLANENYVPKTTRIVARPNPPVIKSENDFLAQVYKAQNIIDLEFLSLFVAGLETVPTYASVISIAHTSTEQGFAVYTIEISGYYDGSDKQIKNDPYGRMFTFNVKLAEEPVAETFPWWWIAVGVGGAAIVIGVLTWFILKKRKQVQ